MTDDAELISLRTRLHEVSGQLHVATVRVEVTATKLDAAVTHLGRLEAQFDRIETAVQDLQRAKANLDGRLLVVCVAISSGIPILLWALTPWLRP